MTESGRISMVDLDSDDPLTKLCFSAATQMLGRVPNSHRVAAHAPFMQMMLTPFTGVMQREGGGSCLTSKLKELAIIKTSHTNGCNY
jgi:hypothetical protein